MQTGQFAPSVDIAGGDARFSIAGLSRRSSWVTLAVTQSPPQRDGTKLRQETLDSVKKDRTRRRLARRYCARAIAAYMHRPWCLLCTRTGHGVLRQPVRRTWRQIAHQHRTRCSLRMMHGALRPHVTGCDGCMGRDGLVSVSATALPHGPRSRVRLRRGRQDAWRERTDCGFRGRVDRGHAAPSNAVREWRRCTLGAVSNGAGATAERCAWERRLEPERGRARLSDGTRRSGSVVSEPCRESAAETEHMTRTNAVREGVRVPRRTVASAVPTSGETVSRRSCDSLCSFASDSQRMRPTVAQHANVRHQLGKRVIHTRAASWCTAVNDVDSRQKHQRTRWSRPRGCKRCEGSPGAMRHMAPCGLEGPSRGPLVRHVAHVSARVGDLGIRVHHCCRSCLGGPSGGADGAAPACSRSRIWSQPWRSRWSQHVPSAAVHCGSPAWPCARLCGSRRCAAGVLAWATVPAAGCLRC